MKQQHIKYPHNKTVFALLLSIACLGMTTNASARPEWAVQLKVFPVCTGCHTSQDGNEGNATLAARTAYRNGGVIPGLQNFLKPANVNKFSVDTAKWATNKLTLSGHVIFKPTITATAKAAALKTLRLSMKSNSGKVVGTPVALTVNATTGVWTRAFALTAKQVPCIVKAEYEGLKSNRIVKPVPTTCLK